MRQALILNNIALRYTHWTATASALDNFHRFGGCKILQFVGYCCNPTRDNAKFPELCKSLQANGYNENNDYLLLETEVGDADENNNICCFGKGVWYSINDLRSLYLNAEQTAVDIIIAMSPQHQRMVNMFRKLGYQYVIGIESPGNMVRFNNTETAAFLDQFYTALLEQRSVSRSFYLALQEALSTRGGDMGTDHDPKYLLTIDKENPQLRDSRFIVFGDDQLRTGEIIDKSQHERLPKTNLTEAIRPFIGRTGYVIKLLKYLIEHRILNVTGKELVGRATVVKATARYLLQMGFFRGGLFVIDCKNGRKYQQQNKSFNEHVYDVLKYCGISFEIRDPYGAGNNHINLNNIQGIDDNDELDEDEITDEDDVPQMNGGYGSNGVFQGITSSTAHSNQPSNGNVHNHHGNANLISNNGNVNTPISKSEHQSHYSSRDSVKFPPVSKLIGGLDEAGTPSIGNNNINYNNLGSPQSQMTTPTTGMTPTVHPPTVNNYGMYSFMFDANT